MSEEIKELSTITRKEWIAYRWMELPQVFGSDDRMFSKAGIRTPDEAMQAMEDWDLTAEDRGL